MTGIVLIRHFFKGWAGLTEYPPGSNKVWINTWYYGSAVAGSAYKWCVATQCTAFWMTGQQDLFYDGKKTASCRELREWAQAKGLWVTKDYQVGDLVQFDFTRKGKAPTHIGWVDEVKGDYCYCYEGNTSAADASNGGALLRMPRHIKDIAGAYRPPYKDLEDAEVFDPTKITDEQMGEILMRLTDAQIYDLMQRGNRYAGQLDAPDWSVDEYGEAIAQGVTDGTRPMAPVTRLEAALMAKRAGKKA